MTIADATLAVFTFFNSVRFLAYIPQIAKAIKDPSGAEAGKSCRTNGTRDWPCRKWIKLALRSGRSDASRI